MLENPISLLSFNMQTDEFQRDKLPEHWNKNNTTGTKNESGKDLLKILVQTRLQVEFSVNDVVVH